MMKRAFFRFGMTLLMTALFTVAGFAQSHPVAGTYKVTATSSELGALNFLMVLTKNGDKWMGEVKDSPMPLTVTSVMVDAENNVTVESDAGGTPVIIKGKFDGGKIVGDWTAGDMKGTWTALRDAAASGSSSTTVASAAAASANIEGEYDAVVVADGQGELPFTLVIKRNGDKLVTEVPGGGDMNIVAIETKDPDVVNLTATYQGNGPIPLNGKRTGDNFGGKWEAGGFSGTWTARKKSSMSAPAAMTAFTNIEGEYDAVVVADGQGELPFTLVIKRDGDKLVTEVPGGGDMSIVAIETKDPDVVNLTATYQGNGPIPLNGKRTGEDMGGKWEAGGFSGTWTAKKKKK